MENLDNTKQEADDKSIAILYFSGTGNCFRVLEKIKKDLELRAFTCSLLSIEDLYIKNSALLKREVVSKISSCKVIGFSYPIYGFNAPKMVNDFVKKLLSFAELKSKNFFIIKTSGEPFSFNNSSSSRIKKYIKKANGNLFYEKHILMPYNIMFRYKDNLVKQLDLASDKLALYSAQVIADSFVENFEIKEVIKPSFKSFIASTICRLVYLSPLLGKSFFVKKDKCINCNLCIKNCPKANIYRNKKGKIKFKFHCMFCMRCVHNCPKDAISMGLFNLWKVSGKYEFEKYLQDDSLDANFVNDKTKGYFKLFKGYFDMVQRLEIKDGFKKEDDK